MASLLLVVFGLILLLGGQLYFRQRHLVFRPSPAAPQSPADFGIAFEDLYLGCAPRVGMHGWWVANHRSDKAIIYFHGSEGNVTYELSTLRFLHSLGASVLIVDYPGYGRSGGKPSERGCYQAAEAAWSFVRETKGFRADHMIVYGQSLGSAVGTYLAASRKCGGLVFQSGFTSVPDMAALAYPYLPSKIFCQTKMNSLDRIGRCHCPVLVLHSETDEHIPFAQALRVYERASGPKRFVCLLGSHFGTYWQLSPGVRAAWEELLSGRISQWERS